MRALNSVIIISLLFFTLIYASGQQSDHQVKVDFETRTAALRSSLLNAQSLQQIENIGGQIDNLEADFSGHSAFLSKALHPESFGGVISQLRSLATTTRQSLTSMQDNSARILDLESKVSSLSLTLDSLNRERDQLLARLTSSNQDLDATRRSLDKLTTLMQAKDRLLFSLIDSLFRKKTNTQLSTDQRENIAERFQETNLLSGIRGIALDNMNFLSMTQLERDDYENLFSQFHQFKNRWRALSPQIQEVMKAQSELETSRKGRTGKKQEVKPMNEVTPEMIDVTVAHWQQKLTAGIWEGLQREFNSHGYFPEPFIDGSGFDSSVRRFLAEAPSTNIDVDAFRDQMWNTKINTGWRDLLTKSDLIDKERFDALNDFVQEQKASFKMDWKLAFYVINVVVIAFLIWWFFRLRKKSGNKGEKHS